MTPADRDAILEALRQGPGTPERIAARVAWPVHLTYHRLLRLVNEGAVRRLDIYSVSDPETAGSTTTDRGTTP